MKKLIGFWVTFMVALGATCQENDVRTLLKKVHDTYKEQAFTLAIHMQVKDSEGSTIERMTGYVHRSKEVHYVQMNGAVQLVRQNRFVALDSSLRTLYYGHREPSKGSDEMMNMLDTLISSWNQLGIEVEDKGNGIMQLYYQTPGDPATTDKTFLFDVDKGSLLQTDMTLRPVEGSIASHVTIMYEHITPKNLRKELLDMDYYIKASGENIQVSQNYYNYELLKN